MEVRGQKTLFTDTELKNEQVDLDQDDVTSTNLGTILIIEDDPRMQKVLCRVFVQERYGVVVGGDGQTGLDLFVSERPLAVILDLILPEISGRELLPTLKSSPPTRRRSWC